MQYVIAKDEFYSESSYTYSISDECTAGDIVRALLAHDINAYISWEDNGDCGMKDGGYSDGKNFKYPAMYSPWGGCHYNISFEYEGKRISILTYDSEQNEASREISVWCRDKRLDEEFFPKLMGWLM